MNHQDVEQLSAYLDGLLSPSDSAQLQARLASEPVLASTLNGMRESRALLRRLPHRRAPRNFLLTPKMVGRKPPLPRSYPVFRFATALATLLFGLSFVGNQFARLGAAPMPAYGMGGGGGGAPDVPVTEAPMLEAAPAEPQGAQETTILSATETPAPTEDQGPVWAEGPGSHKNTGEPAPAFLIPSSWQVGIGLIALLGAACMLLIQRLAARKWRAK